MRTRRPSPDHQAAVSRRLAQLGAELSASRLPPPDEAEAPPTGDPDWWSGHTRVAMPPGGPPAPPPPPPPERPPGPPPTPAPLREGDVPEEARDETPLVPVPGRHAARRRGRLGAAVPEPLQGRVALGSGAFAVVAVLVALGLAVTCWWVVRGDPGQPVGRLTSATAGGSSTPAAGTSGSPAPLAEPAAGTAGVGAGAGAGAGATVTVDVAGKVRRPGIAVLPAGSRVVDALEAAGGARRGVELSGLNLARVLVDGEQVLVGEQAAAVAGAAPGGAGPGAPVGSGGPLVNLNLAAQPELELLPGVGPVTAQSIIAWREEHGGFSAVEELLEVDGIGEVTLAKLTPHVTV